MTEIISTALARYSVAPLPPELPSEPQPVKVGRSHTDFWEYAPLLGCVLSVPAIFIIGGSIGYLIALVAGPVVAFAIVGAIGLQIVASKTASLQAKRDEERRRQWDRDTRSARASSIREADDTTMAMRSLLVASAESHNGLFTALERAQAALEQASAEYKERAIPPFWDAVETAAAALSDYGRLLTNLIACAHKHYQTLETRSHTFPPFPYVSSDLPSEEDVVTQFKRVVRLGHTDDKFAGIWEQRRTTEAIQTGFGSLERAVREVGSNIAGALADVQMSLDGGFDRLVDSQLSSGAAITSTLESVAQSADTQRREVVEVLRSQNSKLDNIQWRRKPLGSRYLRE